MQIVIDISEEKLRLIKDKMYCGIYDAEVYKAIANGTPIPKGHGRIVDISQIDKDKIERDNPIMLLSINGLYIEVVSLDYLDNLQAIIEADHDSGS